MIMMYFLQKTLYKKSIKYWDLKSFEALKNLFVFLNLDKVSLDFKSEVVQWEILEF